MDYVPVTHKFVAVLNKKVPHGKVMNALAHATAGLVGSIHDKHDLRFNNYVDKSGVVHPSISDNPFIILKSDNSNKIRTLRNQLAESNIPFSDFTTTMTVGTYFEQHERMAQTEEEELEYWGIVFFGKASELDPLTKKFSLWPNE